MATVSMRDLLEAGVHFGHQTNRWNPKMNRYIYGARNGVHVIDLSQTVRLFANAQEFIRSITGKGDSVLFVGTKRQAQDPVKDEALRAGQAFVVNRWLGGTLTNFATIRKSVAKLKDYDRMASDGSYSRYTKKEVLHFERERARLEHNVGGIRHLDKLPGAVFLLDPKKEEIAVKEARKLKIPIVAVCDTNCDPDGIDYVIPGNDDAIRAIRVFSMGIAEACIEGGKVASSRREESAREAAVGASDFTVPVDRGGPGPEVQRVSRPEGALPEGAGAAAAPVAAPAEAQETPAETEE